jgi:hypothetical protein
MELLHFRFIRVCTALPGQLRRSRGKHYYSARVQIRTQSANPLQPFYEKCEVKNDIKDIR